ncbi:hypothetical protein ZWY2020_014423 [Hordeum vulgare]|nr:hypothetical protein ZWY2020_014423 [Hordeum vulgare]
MGLLSRSEEVAALVRLKVAAGRIRLQIPPETHWTFTYEMLQRVSRSFALGPELRNAVCVFYLVQGLVLILPWIRFLGARLGIRSGLFSCLLSSRLDSIRLTTITMYVDLARDFRIYCC